MRFQFIKPSEKLASFIKHYWVMETDSSEYDMGERVVPTANVQLMFHYRNPFTVKYQQSTQVYNQPLSLISGLSSSYFDVSTQGASGVIAVVFYAAGACNFFKFPLYQIENQSLHLAEVYNNRIKYIEERICTCTELWQRIAIIEEFIWEQYNQVDVSEIKFLQNSLKIIRQSKGQIQSQQLAEKLSVSAKTLERKFAHLLGKSPKQFIKTIRCQEVMMGLASGNKTYLTEYAYNNGYFDQSHFIKEFKAYSGYTPREFISLKPCNADWLESEFGE